MLPNISRCKDNQTIKFGQLIEYNMRNVFLEKSYTKSFFFSIDILLHIHLKT